ncbi:unnamed protein product [Cladocopium goreaui]|uniref:Ubiquitin-like domain-containing protein n=1 Tax=Cladocopium goreaui TaxID=2562237 RepID=A0A9P1GP32_9DINO|nr:unnamed protein product [Cladocopium goreaui]
MKGHTVLLRNDGRALAFGSTSAGQCNPSLTPGTQYISGLRSPKNDLVVQLDFVHEDDAVRLRCSNLGGQEMLCLNAHDSDPAWGTHKRIACELNVDLQDLRMVLPDGQLLTSNLSGNSWSDSCECGKPNNSKSQASVSHIVIVGAEPAKFGVKGCWKERGNSFLFEKCEMGQSWENFFLFSYLTLVSPAP